jgi:signal transduction histidine kinase
MLHEFLTHNRLELIDLCRARVSERRAPRATPAELEHGIPLFLDQLTLMLAERAQLPSEDLDARSKRASRADSYIARSAALHGAELLGSEFTIDQVVHDYGDLCQSITELADRQKAPITVEEFGQLNMRLDNAIAGAVTHFSHERDLLRSGDCADAVNVRLGELAHEMRNMLNTAILAIVAIRKGGVGFGGATAAALDKSLLGMRTLIDRTLSEVRLESGGPTSLRMIDIAQFISGVRVAAALEAAQKGCELTVVTGAPGLRVEADIDILASAVSNLLQNAFKFTRPHSHVLLRTHASGDRVLIEVEDECGGLAPGVQSKMFEPLAQGGGHGSGVGLGLSLSRRGVEACGGTLSVRDIPGQGCVFTIDLPRKA